jgi:hypothetical protein
MNWNLKIKNECTGKCIETRNFSETKIIENVESFVRDARKKGEHFSVHGEFDYTTSDNETMGQLPEWIIKFLYPLKMEETDTQEIYATARELIRIQQICRDFNMLYFIREAEAELFKFRSIFSKDEKYTFPADEIIQAALNRMIEENSCYCVIRFELVNGEIIRFSTGIIDTTMNFPDNEDGYYKYKELLTFNGKGQVINR